jgi:hypothetical protein
MAIRKSARQLQRIGVIPIVLLLSLAEQPGQLFNDSAAVFHDEKEIDNQHTDRRRKRMNNIFYIIGVIVVIVVVLRFLGVY